MSEHELNLQDLAFAVDGDLDAVSKDGCSAIATILREDPRFTEPLAELQAMAADAGVEHVSDGFEVHRRFETLMSKEWQHPADVLDEDPEETWYEQLLHLATTLADRAEDPAKFLEVERRLEVAYAVFKTGEETFEHFADRLDALDPDEAERTLQRLARRLRHRGEDADVR